MKKILTICDTLLALAAYYVTSKWLPESPVGVALSCFGVWVLAMIALWVPAVADVLEGRIPKEKVEC